MSLSGAGWSDGGGVEEPEPLGSERYQLLGPLGQGGMGEVLHAWDTHLDRAVALKRLKPGHVDPGMEARLLHEARLTAHLDHPGVVAALDVGKDPTGRLYYTMRLIRGRTLHAASDELTLPERLRHLLAATEALAFAHAHGVLHRDVKPENIMVGPFGETQVVDWGLACRLDEGCSDGAVVGTPGYRSPEQERGEPVGPTADVHALGRTLAALLPDPAPPELGAIVDCATAPDPADRYPDGSALAADLRAYLDGRVVGAHGYSPAELLALWTRRYRVPLGFATYGLTLALVGIGVAGWRIVAERNRAVAAERASELVLARSLSALAVEAVTRGARAEAELLGAQAFALDPTAQALGALMAFGAQDRPVLTPLDGRCEGRWLLGPGGVACATEDGLQWGGLTLEAVQPDEQVIPNAGGLWRIRNDQATWVRPDGTASAGDGGAGMGLAQGGLLLRVPGPKVFLTTPERGWEEEPCITEPTVGWAPDGQWLICREGLLAFRTDADTRFVPLPPLELGVRQAAWSVAGPVISSARELVWVDGETGAATRRLRPGLGLIRRLRASPDGRWVWVEGVEHGGVLLDGATGATLARLEDPRWRGADFVDGRLVRTDGQGLVALEPPERPLPDWGNEHGISTAVLSDDGSRLALGFGGGRVAVLDTARSQLAWQAELSGGMTKGVAWDGDGLWISQNERGVQRLDRDGQPAGEVIRDTMCRRLVVVGGDPVCATYGRRDPHWLTGSVPGPAERQDVLVDASSGAPDLAVALSGTGEILVLEPGGRMRSLARIPGAARVDVDRSGVVAVGQSVGWLHVVGPGGETLAEWEGPAGLQDVAIDAEGRWVAASYLDGTARVWTVQGALLAHLGGVHEGRVATLDFGPETLVTAGWDGRVHQWSLEPLERVPAVAELERAWQLHRDAVH